jgi:hypothetical protein
MQEHNVGMWLEGENGGNLLADGSSSQESAKAPDGDVTRTSDAPTGKSQQKSAQETEIDSGIRLSASSVESNPELNPEQQQESEREENAATSSPPQPKKRKLLSDDVEKSSPCKEHAAEKQDVSHDGDGDVSSSVPSTKVGRQPAERKRFEPERCVPDPDCQACRLKYIDPKPTELLLYLHAYKYKVG